VAVTKKSYQSERWHYYYHVVVEIFYYTLQLRISINTHEVSAVRNHRRHRLNSWAVLFISMLDVSGIFRLSVYFDISASGFDIQAFSSLVLGIYSDAFFFTVVIFFIPSFHPILSLSLLSVILCQVTSLRKCISAFSVLGIFSFIKVQLLDSYKSKAVTFTLCNYNNVFLSRL
jgi:hypothetical protein